MSFPRPIQCYHSHADPIWPDGTLHKTVLCKLYSKHKSSSFASQQKVHVKMHALLMPAWSQ